MDHVINMERRAAQAEEDARVARQALDVALRENDRLQKELRVARGQVAFLERWMDRPPDVNAEDPPEDPDQVRFTDHVDAGTWTPDGWRP